VTSEVAVQAEPGQIWLNVEQAAKILGLKPRRLLDLRDQVRHTRVPNPKSGKPVLAFEAADVARFQAERRKPSELGMIRAAPRDVAIVQQPIAARTTEPTPVLHPFAWYTVEEAALYTRLPASFLLQLIQASKLPAFDVGVRPGGRWRVRKQDLDALAPVPQTRESAHG